jgi:anti-sigma factor RsiW
MSEPITEADLQAYIDDQLEPTRRIEVEGYLALHAGEAAQVMDGLRVRNEIRFFLADGAGEGPPPAVETVVLGRRLAQSLRVRSMLPALGKALAAACLVGVGWFGHAVMDDPGQEVAAAMDPSDELAGDAAQAFHLVHMKLTDGKFAVLGPIAGPDAGLVSGLIAALPPGFRHIASDSVPWEGGTARLVLLVGPRGENLVLMVAETATHGIDRPETDTDGGVNTVSWWSGRYAYALSGDVPASALLAVVKGIGSLG